MRKILFICNQNQHRSKTAEELFRGEFETRSAGLYNGQPVTAATLEWADLVVVMEDEQRVELSRRFPKQYLQKQIISLGIEDVYRYGQEELIQQLKRKMAELA